MRVKALSRSINRFGLMIRKHGPEIALAVGVAGTVAGTIWACKKTVKAKDIVEDAKDEIEDIHLKRDELNEEEYTDKEFKKELTSVYAKTGWELTKNYAGPVILEASSLAMIVGGHKVLKGRYLAADAAYLAAKRSLDNYRSHVVDELGEDADRRFNLGMKKECIDIPITNENGEEVVTSSVEYVIPDEEYLRKHYSQYAVIFDREHSTQWSKSDEYNFTFLRGVQRELSAVLANKGFLTYNEILRKLGFKETLDGIVAGMVYNESDPFCDNEVKFDIYKVFKKCKKPNGEDYFEPVIILDFNIDGNVYKLLSEMNGYNSKFTGSPRDRFDFPNY